MLLRNLEILQFNAHEISEVVTSKDAAKSLKTSSIGIGLYTSASRFNHECFVTVSRWVTFLSIHEYLPAISHTGEQWMSRFRYFVGTKLIVRAVRPTAKNEVVGDNYGPVFTKFPREDRRKKLLARYWFECECRACTENWPTIGQMDFSHLRLRYLLLCLNVTNKTRFTEKFKKFKN